MVVSKASKDDFTNGPLLIKLIKFAIPLILTGILQLLFNAADLVVVGRYGSDNALAAVGSTGSLINLIVNMFMGLSVGASVSVAQAYGAKEDKKVSRIVHTAMATSIVGGLAVAAIGFFGAEFFLGLMDTPDGVIELSTLYMQIYFIGMPACMVYNYGAAIIRSVGDTKRPLIILTASGIINVFLNLIFVIKFSLDVAGVAIATSVSQFISAVLIVICLMRIKGSVRFHPKKMRFHKNELLTILKIGIPAGIQGAMFSISNVIIQSSINFFGPEAMSGNAAASNIEGFIYTSMNAFHHTALTFTGQNLGAKKKKRIVKVCIYCLMLVTLVGVVLGVSAYLMRNPLLRIYEPDPDDIIVIEYGAKRLTVIALTYFTCGIMDVLSGVIRGLGASLMPMLITVISICGTRILWIYTVFKQNHTLFVLYLSYPISWILCISIQIVYYIYVYKKTVSHLQADPEHDVQTKFVPNT